MHLDEVKADMYLGTAIPRNYESHLQLADPQRQTDRQVAIRMNEPFRYGGETFYQSGYRRDPVTGVGTTTLQVVTNFGWMIPYVACMIVAIGMLAHFSQTLVRFLRRREEGRLSSAARLPRSHGIRDIRCSAKRCRWSWCSIAAGFLCYAAITPSAASGRNESVRLRQTARGNGRPRAAHRHAGPQFTANDFAARAGISTKTASISRPSNGCWI